MGIDPAPTVLQTDFMSARLRREVWDELRIHLIYKPDPPYSTPDEQGCRHCQAVRWSLPRAHPPSESRKRPMLTLANVLRRNAELVRYI